MMVDTVVTVVQGALVAAEAVWLTIAAWTNISDQRHNKSAVAAMLSMSSLETESPADFAAYGHRRITSRTAVDILFKGVVVAECLIAGFLWVGASAMWLAAGGIVNAELARALAIAAAFGFTALWALFLSVGEWFIYFPTSQSPQYTHFYLLLWGVATLAVLI